jgi:hypothetical protein
MSRWPLEDPTVEELRRFLGVGTDPRSTVLEVGPHERPRREGYFLRVNAPDQVETGYCERGHEFDVVTARSERDALLRLLRELRPQETAGLTTPPQWQPSRTQLAVAAVTLVCGLLLVARALAWLILPWVG